MFCVSGRGGEGQEEYPGYGSRGPGHDGDGREDSTQPGPQGAGGRLGAERGNKTKTILTYLDSRSTWY